MLFDKGDVAAANLNNYSLSSDSAAALRVPKINYPSGMVPVEVVAACFEGGEDGVSVDSLKAVNGAIALDDVLQYLDGASRNIPVFGENSRVQVGNGQASRSLLLPRTITRIA